MKRKALLMTAAAIVALGAFFLSRAPYASAIEPGVYIVEGNPSCAVLNADPFFDNINSDFGFKIEGDYNRTVPMDGTAAGTTLTGGAPADSGNTVTVSSVDNVYFDWSSTLGMDAVIVKGGTDGNVYVYVPEVYGDTGLHSPINPNNGQPFAISHIEFCYDYELDVTKDAAGSYDRTVTWTLDKSVDDNSHSGYAGQVAGTSNWTVFADKTEVSGNYQVTGEISISNNTPFGATIDAVSDVLDDGTVAAVDCGATFPIAIAAGDTLVCSYTASPVDGSATKNTATVTTSGNVGGDVATAGVSFVENLIGYDSGTLSDDNAYNPNPATVINGDTTWNYGQTFTCSDDPAAYGDNGEYSFEVPNEAILNGNLNLSDTEKVTVTCELQPLVPTKNAAGSYDRTVTWTLDKSVDDDAHSGYAGQVAGTSNWTVVADKTEVSDNYQVTGGISIYNPAAIAQTFSVSDYLNDAAGTVASVTCDMYTIPAGETATCSYTASPADASATLNTATVSAAGNADQTATAAVGWTENLIGYDSGTLSDDNSYNPNPATEISGDTTWNYGQTFTCSDDPADYGDNGEYSFNVPNEAILNGNINLSDTENVTVDCYLDALVPSKDAAGTYDRTVTWTLDKSVAPASHSGNPGDTFDSIWTVVADKTEVSDNYQVTGNISVYNPAAIPQTFSVSDVLNDGTAAAVTCDIYTIPAGDTAYCTYTASPADDAATLNAATVSAAGNADQTATATVGWTETLIGYDSGTLADDRFDYSQTISGDTTVTFNETFECPADRDAYDETGTYSFFEINEATLNGNINLSDDARVDVTCRASFVDIYKTTNGAPADPSLDIQFTLFSGVDALDTVSTAGVGSDLQFQTALVPGDSYTICEYPVPAGYTFEVSENGSVVLTYAGPPGATDPTGEIQCFDFTAPDPDTQVTITFNIENSFPGGAPRTPGYWKNWNTCSGGNQQYTADKLNGGLDPSDPDSAGVFLLDDLLPQTLGDFTIETCEDGVKILSAQSLDGTGRANDAAYTLARALLAARLNQDAGACTASGFDFLGVYGFDGTFEQLLSAADAVLSAVEFDGTDSYLAPKDLKGKNNPLKDLAAQALALYEIIDDYNNGEICTGEPSH